MKRHGVVRKYLVFLSLLAAMACAPLTILTEQTLSNDAPSQEPSQINLAAETASGVEPTATLVPALPEPVPLSQSGQNGLLARQYLEALIQSGARPCGSPQELQAAQYIQDVFTQLGYEVQVQPFSFSTEEDERLDSVNVIAFKEGQSPREIVVGAHYDSSDEGGVGADDNASGVAVMLEAAAQVAALETPYTIRFVAFSAEENDLDGSRTYVEQLTSDEISQTIVMINLDSLIAGDKMYAYGDEGSGTMRDWILDRAADEGFSLEGRTDEELDGPGGASCECSDYFPFKEAGIDYVYFEATNWDLQDEGWTQVSEQYGENGVIWHTEFDTMDYLETTFPGRIDQHLQQYVTLLVEALSLYTGVQ
jgi:hypothetical protein